jgi:hypothetical protein
MFDIHCKQSVFLDEPEWVIPQKAVGRGRPAEIVKPDKPPFRVVNTAKHLKKKTWQK